MVLENILDNLRKNKNKLIACSLLFFSAYSGYDKNNIFSKNKNFQSKWHDVRATSFNLGKKCNSSCGSHLCKSSNNLYAALPYAGLCNKKILVEYNNKQIILPIIDIGPWFIDDDYWNKNKVPYAQKNIGRYRVSYKHKYGVKKYPIMRNDPKINGAGIDLSEKAFEKLGINPKIGLVNIRWKFID